MSKSDQLVNILLIGSIVVYLSIWAIGHFAHKFAFLAAFLNIVTGSAIILFWIARQFQMTQHNTELREIMVLLFEIVVIICAVLYIINSHRTGGLKVMQYVFYGIHLTMLVLGLIFMMTFKMNRLI